MALGDIYARGGHYYFGNADQAVLNTTVAGTSLRFSARRLGAIVGTVNRHHSVLQQFRVWPLLTVDQFGNGAFHGTVHGTNVTALEARIEELQAQVADLEETLTTRIAALEARAGTGTAD